MLRQNKIVLEVPENTKLGEKLYQINIDQRIALNQLAIIYFNLLDDPNNSLFYVSNNDGSLYLIKSLNFELKRSYNLTILITNWLGQIEYVHIEIKVKDANDHRPHFSESSIVQNEQITFGIEAFQVIDIVTASDQDSLDHNKLTFNVENCIFMPKNLLVTKHSNQSACNLFNPVNRILNATHQTFGLNLKLHELKNYLNTSSDFFMSSKRSVISFYLDISVKDSNEWTDLTRVNLNIYLNSSSYYNPRAIRTPEKVSVNKIIEHGFKKEIYLIKLKSISALSANTELIRLNNEFVSFNGNQLEQFQPFKLEFITTDNQFSFINIETNFGLVYFNQTLNTEALKDHMLQITVACKVKGQEKSLVKNKLLHKTAKVIIYIDSSLFYGNDIAKDLKYYPIWSYANLEAYVSENTPSKTWLTTQNGQKFTVKSFLIEHTLQTLAKRIPNLYSNVMITASSDSDFQVEPFTGYIRTVRKLDYETIKAINVTLTVKLRNSVQFEQVTTLTVNVINSNDNEPKLSALRRVVDLRFISEIMRTMTLFKVRGTDADNGKKQLDFSVTNERITETNNCSVSYLTPRDWFKIDSRENEATVQLTDVGYDALIHFSSKINHFHLRQCYFTVHLSVKANDGLFTNQLGFQLNVQFDEEHSSLIHARNPPVPVLTSLELPENLANNQDELLVNVLDVVHSYFNHHTSSRGYGRAELARELVNYELKNYNDLFRVDSSEQGLYLREMSGLVFDRETRDAYELFIGVKHGVKSSGIIPDKFRILVKLNDVNDNAPQFFEPLEASLTSYSGHATYGFNQTFTWQELVASSDNKPILTVKAIDLDSGANGEVHYVFNSSEPRSYELVSSLITLDHRTGQIYINPSVKRNNSLTELIESTYANSSLLLQFNVISKDSGHPQMTTAMKCQLRILFTDSNDLIRFNQTFYRFQIPETIDVGFVFGYVNSVIRFSGNRTSEIVVYAITDGDELNKFKIDHRTGALSVQSKLEFKQLATYLLTITAYEATSSNRPINATVRIDLDNVHSSSLSFNRYEYNLQIPENIGQMTKLTRLNVLNTSLANTVSYQLLNHLDKFYMNAQSGEIYNKVTFDFEALKTTRIQLQIKAKSNKRQPTSATCLLNIQVTNINDNSPQFEKTVYFSQVQVNTEAATSHSLIATLLNPLTNFTSTKQFKFVTKVSAKDIDSPTLTYSMLSQTERGAAVNLFQIDSSTGIVSLDQVKFKLLKQLGELKSNEFTLQLFVSDSMLTNQARLTVHVQEVEKPKHKRPLFKIPSVNLQVDISRFKSRKQEFIRLFNLKRNTVQTHGSKFFSFNFDSAHLSLLFSIKSNKLLVFNLKQFKKFAASLKLNTLEYHVPVLVCDRQESSLCDQLLVKVNLTAINESNGKSSDLANGEVSFAYRYGVKTVQQRDTNDLDTKDDLYDEYYLDNADSIANERFYTEIRLVNTKSNPSNIEFELLSCYISFVPINRQNYSNLFYLIHF